MVRTWASHLVLVYASEKENNDTKLTEVLRGLCVIPGIAVGLTYRKCSVKGPFGPLFLANR